MNDLLSFAQIYKSLGWSVIPIRAKSKMPAVAWKPYQKKIATDEELKNWFGGKKAKDIGIGLVTGKLSNVVVVDLDLYKDGSLFLKLETPVIVKTGGGGLHGYFKYREGIRNTVEIKEGADIRGEGGYVVLPPSIHPSGATYKWEKQDFKNMPEFPVDDFERIEKEGEKLNIADMVNVDHGSRNDNLYRTACSLLNHINPKEAFHVIEQINRTYDPPVLQRELVTLFESAYNFVSQDLEREKEEKEEISFGELKQKYPIEPMNEFVKHDFPQVKWLIEPLVRATGIVLLQAEGGVGKTTISYHMAKSITQNTPWLDKFDVTKEKILFLDKENEDIDVKTNFLSMQAANSDTFYYRLGEQFNFFSEKEDGSLSEQALFLKEFCQREDIKVVVMDSLVDFFIGNENAATDAAENINAWRQTFENMAIIVIHHESKPQDNYKKKAAHRGRGSTHIFNSAQTVLSFTVDDPINYPDTILVEHSKVRGAKKTLPFEIERTVEEDPTNQEETIVTGFKFVRYQTAVLSEVEKAKILILQMLAETAPEKHKLEDIQVHLSEDVSGDTVYTATKALRIKNEIASTRLRERGSPFVYWHKDE